ncbi:MAG: hypothetical protein ACI8ZN_002667, partial [Bacteroidia bacterium]
EGLSERKMAKDAAKKDAKPEAKVEEETPAAS